MDRSVEHVNEKRGVPRHPAEMEIVYQPYSSSGSVRQSIGMLRNYSNEGIYIEAPHGYKAGTILIIRTAHCAPSSSSIVCGEGLRTICLAEVKWRQELPDPEVASFGMGLSYLT